MHNLTSVWIVGSLATAATTASTVFNAILAVATASNEQVLQSLRTLLFVGLGFSFLGSLSLIYFTVVYASNVKSQSLHLKSSIWIVLAIGAVIGLVSVVIPLITLIWLLTSQYDALSLQILGRAPIVWIAVWFACCGVALLAQLALFTNLGLWTRHQLENQSDGRLDIDFGTRLPPTAEVPPSSHRSYNSRDTTVVDLPSSPSTKHAMPSSRGSDSSRAAIAATTSRTKLISAPRSAKSSLEIAPFPAGEASTMDDAFDRWDTSSVHSEMRAAVGTLPVARSGLETIPGSRSETPEDGVDAIALASSPPQAISSDTATAVGEWSSSPSRVVRSSSPPSSPPNFSRPTSKNQNKAASISKQDMIHPLFRASSPQPPPIAIAGTIITASPMADQPITPRTLTNLRSHNKSSSSLYSQFPKPTGHWRAMPSLSQYSDRRPSTPGSQGPGSPPPGSPGPSIVDEDELPPILPGFVLSAGQRTSMLGYASRKSIKRDQRGSQLSTTR